MILAPFSGITAEQYDLLADIAPTVAYQGQPWTTPWRDVIGTVGTTLGRTSEAQQVLAGIDATLAEHCRRTSRIRREVAGSCVGLG